MRILPVAILVVDLVLSASSARADDARAWFDKAVQVDTGSQAAAPVAFAWFRRAAEAGLPEAEFNVAAMLDSGRGVAADVRQAAIWYARAAARGNHRAAYDLGQLYEAGEGVPKNADLARAWFMASDLEAARERLANPIARPVKAEPFAAPTPLAPEVGSVSGSAQQDVELVWTASQQPEPVQYFVELRALAPSGSREVFSAFLATSSIVAPLPDHGGSYAWRVAAVGRKASRYAVSAWTSFTSKPPN